MNAIRPTFLVCALLLLVLTWTPSVHAQPATCRYLPDPRAPGMCYPAAQVKVAEAALATPPIPAQTVVEQVTHLHLKQVTVLETEVANPGTPQVYVIHYFFGAIPHAADRSAVAAGKHPRYVLVSEFASTGGGTPAIASVLTRDPGQLPVFHVSPGTGRRPWTAHNQIPGKNLTIWVTSNVSSGAVRLILKRLLAG